MNSDMLLTAKFGEVLYAQEAYVRGVEPPVRKGIRHGGLTSEKQHATCAPMGEIWKSNNEDTAHPQGFIDQEIHMPHLLHALIENHIVKGVVRILLETGLYVTMERIDPLFYARLYCRIIEFYALSLYPLVFGKEIEEIAWAAAKIKNPRFRLDDFVDDSVIQPCRW